MTPEEAKERLEADTARLQAMEEEVVRLANTQNQAPIVVLALIRTLIEWVCRAQGPNFTVHNKLKFYEGVLLFLRQKGIE